MCYLVPKLTCPPSLWRGLGTEMIKLFFKQYECGVMERMITISDMKSEIQEIISTISHAWQTGRTADMAPYFHPNIVMKYPKFKGEAIGKEKILAGFEEFYKNARVLEYGESDQQIDIIDNCAVVSYNFNMLYERTNYRERSVGRDLWIFQRESNRWLAVWRTLVDLTETREQK